MATQAEPIPALDVSPSVSNHFAWLRTQFGLQRTLMAAVRTSVSLIGFGFTVAQFFQRLENDAGGGRHVGPNTPRNLGLVLIGAGIISLIVSTWQYHNAVRYLKGDPFKPIAGRNQELMRGSTYLTAIAVVAIGFAAFASVFVHF
ncbi:MAG: DUF202 domain-containing protein [Pseudomonadota bacterium]